MCLPRAFLAGQPFLAPRSPAGPLTSSGTPSHGAMPQRVSAGMTQTLALWEILGRNAGGLAGCRGGQSAPRGSLPLTCTTECNSDRSSRQMRLVQRISPVALEGLSPISLRDAPSPRRGRLYGSSCPRRRHQTRYRPFAAWPYLLSPSAESTSDDEGCRPSHNKRQASNLMLAPRPTHRQPPTAALRNTPGRILPGSRRPARAGGCERTGSGLTQGGERRGVSFLAAGTWRPGKRSASA